MKKLFALLAALIPVISFAHEGHGTSGGYTIIHYITEPVHLVSFSIMGLLVFAVYWKLKSTENKA